MDRMEVRLVWSIRSLRAREQVFLFFKKNFRDDTYFFCFYHYICEKLLYRLMFIIGLDLSINYSSYTVLDTDRNEVSFGSVINDVSISKKKMDRLSDLSSMTEGLYFDFTSSAGNKTSVHQLDYLNCERMKLLNYIEISKLLCNSIIRRRYRC